jgi:hypothetical protein
MTEYNMTSCRACGGKLLVVKTCQHCGEPVVWYCHSCFIIYDSVHAHPVESKAKIATAS